MEVGRNADFQLRVHVLCTLRLRGLLCSPAKLCAQSKTPEGGNYVPFGRLATLTIFAALLYVNDGTVKVREKHAGHTAQLGQPFAQLSFYRSIRDAFHASREVAFDSLDARCRQKPRDGESLPHPIGLQGGIMDGLAVSAPGG